MRNKPLLVWLCVAVVRSEESRRALLDAAATLFYARGIRPVSIDMIVEASGVSRMTLYRHFPSKQDLVRAYLQRRDEASWRWFVGRVGELGDTAEARLLAMFDALREWFETPEFRGCAFLNASAEYSEGDAEIRSLVSAHKNRIEEFIRAEAAEAGAADPPAVASGIFLLLEGATVTAQWAGSAEPAGQARQVAEAMLRALLPQP